MKYSTIFLILAALVAASCKKEQISSEELSLPHWSPIETNSPHKKIVIASTNSFLGKTKGLSELPTPTTVMRIGGIKALEFYINTLREKYSNNLLLLDGGYLFDNGHSSDRKNETASFYERMKYDAVLYTENEFGTSEVNYSGINFLNSNILDLKTTKLLSRDYLRPHIIKEVNGIKVGIIGTTSFKKEMIKDSPVQGIYFEDPILSLLKTREQLVKKGAEVFILMAHFQTECETHSTKEMPEPIIKCPKSNDELKKMIKRIPAGYIDLIVGGDAHNITGYINDIPVIQNSGNGKYINKVELIYNTESKEVDFDKSRIYSPIKLCKRFFKVSNDCHVGDSNKEKKIQKLRESNYKQVTAKFLGKLYKED